MELDPRFDSYGVTANEVHGYRLKQPIGFLARHNPEKPKRNKMKSAAVLQPKAELSAGVKLDDGKDPWHLAPFDAICAIVKVLAFGAKKYEPRNWEKGMDWSRLYSALMRHLVAWWSGDKGDPDTGYSHLWHAGCCILFLIAYEIRGIGKDDRPCSPGR